MSKEFEELQMAIDEELEEQQREVDQERTKRARIGEPLMTDVELAQFCAMLTNKANRIAHPKKAASGRNREPHLLQQLFCAKQNEFLRERIAERQLEQNSEDNVLYRF